MVKQLNNNGFAISTILYGLLVVLILITTLIIGTMSFTRKNSKTFTDTIIKQLEKSKSTSYDIKQICKSKARAYSFKNSNCDEIIDNIKQDYFSVCYRNSNNQSYCNNELLSHGSEINGIYANCQNKTYSIETTVRNGCCLSNSQDNSSSYNSCIN